jgi:L-asparaginase
MLPYSVNQSDGLFNLGFALSSVQNQPLGVYIAMNGQVFDFDKVQKNTIPF